MVKTKIIIADPHALFRKVLKKFIKQDPNLSVVNEAGDGLELLDFLEENIPDIIIIDISMPKLSGLDTAAIIKQRYPEIKLLIMSLYREEMYGYKAFEIGADKYMAKDEMESVNIAIKGILEGKAHFTSV